MHNKKPGLGYIILIALILCIALPIVGLETYYWQYCWFPPSGSNIEIVVSACEDPVLSGASRDGHYLSFALRDGDTYQLWLLDTLTNKRELDTLGGDWWLDSTVRLGGYVKTAGYPGGFTISDISDGTKVDPQWVENIPGTTTQFADYTETYSPEVVEWFRNAKKVYYISSHQWAVALNPDFKEHPENSYVLTNSDTDPVNSVLKFLKDHQISYDTVGYPSDGSDVVSHSGHFVIPFFGEEGFYTTNSKKIGPLFGFITNYPDCCSIYGWAYDDSGIYVQANTQASGAMFPYPPKAQPILKINLPSEYLTLTARQQLESYQDRMRRTLIIKVITTALLAAGVWFFWWRRKKNIMRLTFTNK